MPRSSYPSYGAPNAAGYGAAPNPAPYGAAPNAPGGGAHPPPIGFNPSVVHGASSCKLLFHTRGYYTVVQRYELYFKWCFMLQNPEISTGLMSKLACMQTLPCY